MSTTRQDAWTNDEDLLLAEVVLRNIREGGTQLAAFEEVGRRLSRTAAACGFRWNSYVRKQYKSGIELAKKQRKQLKNGQESTLTTVEQKENDFQSFEPLVDDLSLKKVITYLQIIDSSQNEYDELVVENKQLKKRVAHLENKMDKVDEENQSLLTNLRQVEDDYKALIEIMERARKMVVLQEEEKQSKVKFQMDRNGNLERVEK
ncbi:RsfA family transcriptional regulator [Cytobacillus sp. Hm23]